MRCDNAMESLVYGLVSLMVAGGMLLLMHGIREWALRQLHHRRK